MWLQLTTVLYMLVAIAMIGLILMQRGAGAQAGSGFGGGASATVFGSRGSSNFLTKSTAYLAAIFFVLSLGMAIYAGKVARQGATPKAADLGVMAQQPVAPAQTVPNAKVPTAQAPAQQPAAPVAAPQYGQPPAAAPAPTQAPAPDKK